MKFFKVTLNTVAGDNEYVMFIIPSADDNDENGNPIYDENALLCSLEYKNYIKMTKADVVAVKYVLYEAEDKIKLNYDELLNSIESFKNIDENEYLIEVKKAKAKGGKKSSAPIYIVLGIAAVAVIGMLIYGGSIKKQGKEPQQSGSDTNSTISEADTNITIETEAAATSEASTTANSLISPSISDITVSATEKPEKTFTLTFDKNGGTGSLTESQYSSGTVVNLPLTALSKAGYTLVGWTDSPNSLNNPYKLYNESNKFVMPSADVTLYAIWTAAEYEVTYYYQIGANAASSKAREKYGEVIQLMDVSGFPSDKGKFIGWGLLPDAVEPIQSLTMPDGGVELYAIYKKE